MKQYLALGVKKWIWYSVEHRKWKSSLARLLIGRVCSGYTIRCRYLRARLELRLAEEREAKKALVKSMSSVQKAIKIQSQMRRYLAARRVLPLLHRDRAARKLQQFCVSWMYVGVVRKAYLFRLKKIAATFLLLRVARGFLGRKVKLILSHSSHTLIYV